MRVDIFTEVKSGILARLYLYDVGDDDYGTGGGCCSKNNGNEEFVQLAAFV